MAKRKAKKHAAKKAKPIHVPVEMREQLNRIIAVLATAVDALSAEEENESINHTLLDCALEPLRAIRDKLEAAR